MADKLIEELIKLHEDISGEDDDDDTFEDNSFDGGYNLFDYDDMGKFEDLVIAEDDFRHINNKLNYGIDGIYFRVEDADVVKVIYVNHHDGLYAIENLHGGLIQYFNADQDFSYIVKNFCFEQLDDSDIKNNLETFTCVEKEEYF